MFNRLLNCEFIIQKIHTGISCVSIETQFLSDPCIILVRVMKKILCPFFISGQRCTLVLVPHVKSNFFAAYVAKNDYLLGSNSLPLLK